MQWVKSDKCYNTYYSILAFLLGTGCRISEAVGMTWDDIDFQNKQISVNHQVIYGKKNGKYQFYTTTPKNGTSRIISVKDDLLVILRRHKTETYLLSSLRSLKWRDTEILYSLIVSRKLICRILWCVRFMESWRGIMIWFLKRIILFY